jgi:hypothetical protein
LSFSATGFASKTIAGELHAGETLNLPQTALAIDTLATEVNVTQTQAELAEAQSKWRRSSVSSASCPTSSPPNTNHLTVLSQ